MSSCVSTKPFPIVPALVQKSPFKTVEKLHQALDKWARREPIGFTYVASLKSMGLIPRNSGMYQRGKKYTVDAIK